MLLNIFTSQVSGNKRPSEAGTLCFFFVSAHKRSLGQGYIFTSVCESFCPRGGGWCLCPGGGRGLPDRHPPGQRPPDRNTPHWTETIHRTVKSGWYASYWNAFFLLFVFVLKHNLFVACLSYFLKVL